jgi:quercetin dioxygenase-like cupin family protein
MRTPAIAAALLLLSASLPAQGPADTTALRWIPAPALLLPGARLAVVSGDPAGPVRTTVELELPDGYRMPPQFHPVDEFVEVLSGTLLVGIGDRLDPRRVQALGMGDTATAPAGVHHFTVARGPTRVRVTFLGPYIITYVNAYEAPRGASFPFVH